jgi:hypothetical protein
MALEDEIHKWKSFADSLSGNDREAFEILMDSC